MAARVWQLKTHEIFARNSFDYANTDQAQRARQIFCQIDNLTAFDAGGRFNFVARNHRARLSGYHVHFDSKVSQFLFDQPGGKFNRLVGNGFKRFGRWV